MNKKFAKYIDSNEKVNMTFSSIFIFVTNLYFGRATFCSQQFESVFKSFTGNMTFKDIYEQNGWDLCITVTNKKTKAPLLCSWKTTPNVMVYSAVVATCSIPLLWAPYQLLERDDFSGKVRVFCNDKSTFYIDGMFSADINIKGLR